LLVDLLQASDALLLLMGLLRLQLLQLVAQHLRQENEGRVSAFPGCAAGRPGAGAGHPQPCQDTGTEAGKLLLLRQQHVSKGVVKDELVATHLLHLCCLELSEHLP
jgi:hypothetical protein